MLNVKDTLLILSRIGIEAEENDIRNGQLTVHCPFAPWFHSSKIDINPSMSMRCRKDKTFLYHCHACKESGNLHDLIESFGHLTDQPSLVELAEQIRIQNKPSLSMRLSAAVKMCGDFDKPNKDRKKFVWPMLEKFPEANYCTPSGMYLLGRNCREAEVYEQYNLRYDIEKSRVVFPISINGDLCGAQGRYVYDSDKVLKYWNYWNFERAKVIGGYDQAKESENTGIIVVEGFFDMLPHIKTAEELGYNMVCTFGAMMTQEQANLIISLDKSVLICYDMDLAGEKGWKSCNRLHKRVPSLRRIKCRKDEDAGDMTKESFREMVQSSFKKGKYYV